MGHTDTKKKKWLVHLKFNFNWAAYIFICYTGTPIWASLSTPVYLTPSCTTRGWGWGWLGIVEAERWDNFCFQRVCTMVSQRILQSEKIISWTILMTARINLEHSLCVFLQPNAVIHIYLIIEPPETPCPWESLILLVWRRIQMQVVLTRAQVILQLKWARGIQAGLALEASV